MRRKTIRWTEKDELDLLATLDFVIEAIRKESGRLGTTEEVLQHLTSELPEPKRTQDQIDKKLRTIWKKYNPNPESWKTYERIYRYGTGDLEMLASNLRSRIDDELDILDSNQKLKAVGTPRKMRSKTKNNVADSRDINNSGDERSPTKGMRKRNGQPLQTSTSKRIKQDGVSSKTLWVEVPRFVQRQRETSEEHFRLQRTTRSTTVYSESTMSGTSSFMRVPDVNNSRRPLLDKLHHPETPSQAYLYADRFRGTPALDYDDTNSARRLLNTNCLTKPDETLLDLYSDNQYFRGELTRLEELRRRMIENERVRNSTQAKDLSGIVEERNQTIAELKQRLEDQAFTQELLGKRHGKIPLPSRDKIKSSFEDMRKNVFSLPLFQDITYTADAIDAFDSKDLTALKVRVLENTEQPQTPDNVSYSLDVWVQSFIGAAVCEWVFKESFQCAAMMNTPLLEGYRRFLSTLCNDEMLRTIDSVAHQFVVDSLHFKKVFLPRTARKLTTRFLNSLAPLVEGEYSEGEDSFKEELEAIFRSALEIKMLGLTANHIFEFIWPSRGTNFESDLMSEEALRGSSGGGNDSKTVAKKVLLVLLPGLRIYEYERQSVGYCNFTSGDEKGLESGEILALASVMAQ